MNRREYLKLLIISSAGTIVLGCKTENKAKTKYSKRELYGRTPEELAHDEEIYNATFFTEKDLTTIAILCDIILPPKENEKNAEESGLVEFIDFVVKDMDSNQDSMKEGLAWLTSESQKRFQGDFQDLTEDQRIEIIDDIAYPNEAKEEMKEGVSFFNHIRNLVVTGYYTSKAGIEDLGYQGNKPNIWDGVPKEVLEKHGLSYDEEWLAKCVDQSTRGEIAKWDENKNLIA